MKEQISKAFYAGLGAASLTIDKVKEVGEKLAKEFDLSEEEGRKMAQDMKKKSDTSREELKNNIKEEVQKILEKMDIPSREDYDNLMARIEALEKKNIE